MLAMIVERAGQALRRIEVPTPRPAPGQLLIRVHACAVCRTDLHIADGELADPKRPLIPGHEVVGRVAELGAGAGRFKIGDRVGVPWLGWSCDTCSFCRSGRENLCDAAQYTGYHLDGGYAEYMVADQRYCFAIPECYSDAEAAPLLCAGLIGYRGLAKAGAAKRLGIYGSGAAAHIVAQVARYQGRQIYAFTRAGDGAAQKFARDLGALWAGGSDEMPPEPLAAAIIFAPAGELIPRALQAVGKGGVVVCGGIHMSDVPSFPYAHLWQERTLTSVANLTRRDGEGFLALAPRVPVRTAVECFPLDQANQALAKLRAGQVTGAAVLVAERDPNALRASF